MSKRAPIKVSGLVSAGKVSIRSDDLIKDPTPAPTQVVAEGVTSSPEEITPEEIAPVEITPARPTLPNETPSLNSSTRTKGAIKRIPLRLIDDSPYQPRLEYDPEEIDALAKTMAAARQADPIKVRPVNGRYELISGHRRKRAAASLGWDEIEAFVEVRSDRDAQIDAMLLVVGNVGLADFELGKMFRRALDDKICSSQREVANFFAMNTSKVSGCLDLLKLPSEIVALLEAKPSLFGYETGRVIKGLLEQHPDHLDVIVRGVRRIIEGAKQNSLKGWVLQAIKGNSGRSGVDKKVITNAGRPVFETRHDPEQKVFTINCKVPGMDTSVFESRLQAFLESQAQAMPSAPDTTE